MKNGTCTSSYSPFETTYPETSGCGNVYVKGNYSGQLTIAAENDIIVNGNIKKEEGSNGLLGLIANNFIRVYHPCSSAANMVRQPRWVDGKPRDRSGDPAINHSFIVDNYNCGERWVR